MSENHFKKNIPAYLGVSAAGTAGTGLNHYLKNKSAEYADYLDKTQGTSINASVNYDASGNNKINVRVDRVKEAPQEVKEAPQEPVKIESEPYDNISAAAGIEANRLKAEEYWYPETTEIEKNMRQLINPTPESLIDPRVDRIGYPIDYIKFLNNANQNEADIKHEVNLNSITDALSENTQIKNSLKKILTGTGLGLGLGAGYWATRDPVISSNANQLASNLKNTLSLDSDVGEKARLAKMSLLGARENISNWLPHDNGIQIIIGENMTKEAINKIEILIEEFNDGTPSTAKKAATLGGVGALGYGLGTGAVQSGAKYAYNTPLTDMGSTVKEGLSGLWDSAKTATIGGGVDKANDAVSSILGD